MRMHLVFLDGSFRLTPALRSWLAEARLVAADHAAARMARHGLVPDVVVGDFDGSEPPPGIPQRAFPTDKNLTDGELAVDEALSQDAGRILIVGAFGGRYDMALSHLALLRRTRQAGVLASLTDGVSEALLATRRPVLAGGPGDTLSIIPLTPSVRLDSRGLRWPLGGLLLTWDTARGLSNQVVEAGAFVHLKSGQALVVRRLPPRPLG